MQRSKSEPRRKLCVCGKTLDAADIYVYRSFSTRFTFHRCDCGVEWTERQDDVDRTQPVTGDEIITVHQTLTLFEGSLQELFTPTTR